jgi:hypothetical protein
MSAALVTRAARWSRMSAWQPADITEVAGPGTAINGRSKLMACWAVVLGVPLRTAASMITVPRPRAAMIGFLSRNWDRAGLVPGGEAACC